MEALQSYPIFEADQVLSNAHLNNLLNYLEQQERLTRIKLLGRGIVCGLEITSSGNAIAVSKGCGLTSQGYLIHLCETNYTHFVPYSPPTLPNDLYFLKQCEEANRENIPFYHQEGVLELVSDQDKEQEDKMPITGLKLNGYVVVLFLEATQNDLKNCDTQDCNDKGSRMEFELKPLLVKKNLLETGNKILFNSILLKRYNVPVQEIDSSDEVLKGFLDITDDNTLTKLSQNLFRSWARFAPVLDLPDANPFSDLDLVNLKRNFVTNSNQRIYSQYFYDFIDDLCRAYFEFRGKVREVFGGCCPDEMDFPMHLALGLASQNTVLGRRNDHRHYFSPSAILDGHKKQAEEATFLLERLVAMVSSFMGDRLQQMASIIVTPSNHGKANLAYRAIPFYYEWDKVNPLWYFNRSYNGNENYNLGYQAGIQPNAPEPVSNPLLYDIERYDFFRVEGHVGKNYRTALQALLSQKAKFNLPVDIIALNALHLADILNGKKIHCLVSDLESDYRVLITGIVCQLNQIITYVGNLRPQPSGTVGVATDFVSVTEGTRIQDFLISKKVMELNTLLKKEPTTKETSIFTNAEIINNLVMKSESTEEKLADFVGMNLGDFAVNFRDKFVYVLPQPDILLIFLQQLAEIIKYLITFDLHEFKEEEYQKLWNAYAATVNKIIAESANSDNEEIRKYFSPKNNEVFFKCANEKLFALREEYKNRLEQYQTAVNFNHYFKKHPGLEHKAGVPKGGTLVLVYHAVPQSTAPNLTGVSDFAAADLGRATLSASVEAIPSGRVASLSTINPIKASNITEFQLAADLIKKLNLGDDSKKVLEILNLRDREARIPGSQIPNGLVIADFYLPYMCCSDCPPIAYVFPGPDESEPEPTAPTIAMDVTEFCDNDNRDYPVHVHPEGGTLSVNGEPVDELSINPSSLGGGDFNLTYELEDQSAQMEISISESHPAEFDLSEVSFASRGGWNLSFDPKIDASSNHIWRINGQDSNFKGVLNQNFAQTRGEAIIGLSVINPVPCPATETEMRLEFSTQEVGICGRPGEFTHTMREDGEVQVLEEIEGVKVDGNTITILLENILNENRNVFMLPVYQKTETGYLFTLLGFAYLDASFTATFRQVFDDVITTRGNGSMLSITLTARHQTGTSTWFVNGNRTEPSINIPQRELAELRSISISHQIEFRESDCVDERKVDVSMEEIARGLESGNGQFTITV